MDTTPSAPTLPDHPDSGPRVHLPDGDILRLRYLGRSRYEKDTYWAVYDLDGRTVVALNGDTRGWAWECSPAARGYVEVPA